MKVIEGSTRIAFLCYFISHIPITICIDAQGILGPFFPKPLTDLVAWYCNLFGDILMKNSPSIDYAWFSAVVGCEMLFQLPFFFVAIKFIMAGGSDKTNDKPELEKQHYPEWFRMLCIVYGAHVSTTLVPIIAVFATSYEMTLHQKYATIAIYSPYLIFPFWLMWLGIRDEFVSGHSQKAGLEKKLH